VDSRGVIRHFKTIQRARVHFRVTRHLFCPRQFGEALERFARVEADRLGPFRQLDDVDDLLAGFDDADVILAALEPLGEVDLAQAGALALFEQECA
jgi:hypothetical protein